MHFGGENPLFLVHPKRETNVSISRPEIRQEMEGLQRIAAEKVEALKYVGGKVGD